MQNVPACIGFAMARQVSEGRSQVTNQTSSPRYSLVTLSPWVNDSVKHISFMYGAFSIAQKIIFLGRGEDIQQELFFIMSEFALGKYGLWTNKKDVNRPVDLYK